MQAFAQETHGFAYSFHTGCLRDGTRLHRLACAKPIRRTYPPPEDHVDG